MYRTIVGVKMKELDDAYLKIIDEQMELNDEYDVVWKDDFQGKTRKKGNSVGHVIKQKNKQNFYRTVHLTPSKCVMVNRIAWYLHTGQWPLNGIILKNGNPNDFSPKNMIHQNPRYVNIVALLESYKNKKVKIDYSKKLKVYIIRIVKDGKQCNKRYDTYQEAYNAKIEYYNERIEYYKNHGKTLLEDYLKRNNN